MPQHGTHWHHSPPHALLERGTYMITAGTYNRKHFFATPQQLHLLQDTLLEVAHEFDWELQAWAVFPNHYHFLGVSPGTPETWKKIIKKLHANTSREINKQDGTPGRQVWYQFWDSRITIETSYYARLHYVNANAVHHGIVKVPSQYPWCSAARFENEAPSSFRKMIYSMPIDRVSVEDSF